MTGEMDSDYYLGELTLSRDVLLHFLQSLPKRKKCGDGGYDHQRSAMWFVTVH